jgi:hypothetical protein
MKYKKADRATNNLLIREIFRRNSKRFRALALVNWKLARIARARSQPERGVC